METRHSLDSNLRDDLGHEIRKLSKQFGLTCINVTQDRREAQILSDRIAVMEGGRVQQVGAPLEVFTRPGTVGIARFVNAGNIVSRAFLDDGPWTDDWLLLPRNALQVAPSGGEVAATVQDMVFIDGRFEVKVEARGQELTFFSDSRPSESGQIELTVRRETVVPLSA